MLMNKSPDSRTWALEFRDWLFSRKRMAAIAGALALGAPAGLLLWTHGGAVVELSPRKVLDLSELFRDGADKTLDGDFIDLRDPACTKSFPLHLTQRVFMRMSRNCKYAIHVELGRARANFLNANKGGVELAPGRSWSATDFWSLNPLTTVADVRLEPTS